MRTHTQALILKGESESVEFKTSLSDTRRILDTVAAMATIGGGSILVGVRDDGTVLGVDLGEGRLEQLGQRILSATDPKVFVRMETEELPAGIVLRIDVPPGDGPHLANGRAFVRSGPATVQLSRDEYERRLLERLRESAGYERHPLTEAGFDDLDRGAIERFVELAAPRGVTWDGAPRSLLDRLHLLRDGHLTVGAMLLFGHDPQRLLPQAVVRMRVERGTVDVGHAVSGPLIRQIEETVRHVQLGLRRTVDRRGVVRQERDELPLVALREVVVNALAHRDYRSTAPVQVRLDDARLEVWNPGHLPSPLTVAALRQPHPSVPTNPRIARALYLAGFVEEWGTGTLRVVSSMLAQGNGDPLFDASLGGVSVVLPLLGSSETTLSERQKLLLNKVRGAGQSVRASGVAAEMEVSLRTLQNDLSALEELGLVRREGRGRALRWSSVD